MNFVAQLEDYLRDLGAEARKKHPGVKEASERAILKLRSLQNVYVSAVRKAGASGEKHPDTSLFRSSDLLHPFLLAANYPNASPKLLDTSFKAMKTLMEANAICPGDGMNMVRVWMIQAHVVVSYSTKESSTSSTKNLRDSSGASSSTMHARSTMPQHHYQQHQQQLHGMGSSSNLLTTTSSATTNSTEPSFPTNTTTTSSNSSSSWFGSFLSTSSAAATEAIKSKTNAVVTKTAVSSSHGQAGSGHLNAKYLEKLALDILSCLLQLLELRDLPVTVEQWTQSVTICCLLYLPSKQQQVVRQAAHSTLPQILTLLIKADHGDARIMKFATSTWDDLLACTLGGAMPLQSTTTGKGRKRRQQQQQQMLQQQQQQRIQQCQQNLHGAFSQCRFGDPGTPQQPSVALSVELMTKLLKEHPTMFERVGEKTLGVVVQTLQRMASNGNYGTPLDFLRILQFVLIILQTQHEEWPFECRELVLRVIQPISSATEALRRHADFEDGYVYNNKAVITVQRQSSAPGSFETLRNLPPTSLWKAGLCLEAIKCMVQDESLRPVFMHPDIVVQLFEATSDFCTIGASCQEHMGLLVLSCRQDNGLFHAAESLVTSNGNNALSFEWWKEGRRKDEQYILGDALWIGFGAILKMIDSLDDDVLDHAFAPSLAVLQHYLKRFPASGTLVKRSLEGYFSIAKVALRSGQLLRRALLTSLCKLSLPQWGTHDPTCLLQDHNIAALICLLNVVHRFYNHIGSEWQIVLQTFQELSVLPIASPYLSDNAYVGALSISAVFSRFASFSTCLQDDSLTHFVQGLKETSQIEQALNAVTVTSSGGSDIQIHALDDRTPIAPDQDEKVTIGEKLMNIGVRAIYGSSDGVETDDVPLAERTKNSFHHEYQTGFSRRLAASKHHVRVGKLPFAMALLIDTAMMNSFRYVRCGPMIFRNLCTLAAESPVTRLVTMDTVAMLAMSHISKDSLPFFFAGPGKIMYENPRRNQYLAVEQTSSDGSFDTEENVFQGELLAPLFECIRTVNSAEVAEAGLEALHSVLESSGHKLTSDVWPAFIDAVASLSSVNRSSPDWANSCLAGFRCLKLIVDDFLDSMDSSTTARTSLQDCCFSFGSSLHDVNTSLTAIGLLWTIADQDAGNDSIERALSKLVLLSSDSRAEVRNCSVNTLFSCIVGRGQGFSASQWETCICDMVFGVYDLVSSKGVENDGSSGSEVGKSRYKVSVHHSRDSAGKQWVATQALVLRGLCRVLRAFFPRLLDTVDDELTEQDVNDTPWFEKAWNRVLGYAFEAATQVGGRDTLELRSAGVELLVVCNQLACSAGIHAAITPARVGTNMEVVNGALRSVRSPDTPSSRKHATPKRTHSTITETWRENLFLDAFDVLDSFREHIQSDAAKDNESGLSPYLEPTLVQVLGKFAADLSKLYDCCKLDEFSEDINLGRLVDFEKYLTFMADEASEEDALVTRFVRIALTVAKKASSGSEARFLSQAQRSSVDLLRSMAANGSPTAFTSLTALGGLAFFSGTKNGSAKTVKDIDILRHEAAIVVSEEVFNDVVSHECKAVVLCLMLAVFIKSIDRTTSEKEFSCAIQSYDLMKPILKKGLDSAKELEANSDVSNGNGGKLRLLDKVWSHVCLAFEAILCPPRTGGTLLTTQHAIDLVDLLEAATKNVPPRHFNEFCRILSSAAQMCLDLAQNKPESSDLSPDAVLKLFMACFSGVCTLHPADKTLQEMSENILKGVLEEVAKGTNYSDLEQKVGFQASLLVCRVMERTEGVEPLAISIFPLLCKLVGTEQTKLRRAVGAVLARIDVGSALQNAREMCQRAEERAQRAEERAESLDETIQELRKRNQQLEELLRR